MKKSIGVIGALTLGLGLALAAPTAANADPAATPGTIYVPDDFVRSLSDTRATGEYDVAGTGLHLRTYPNPDANGPNTNKVAEYVATSAALAVVGEPSLEYSATSGITPPGFQLVVDFNADGSVDGILVGEPTSYGTDWWLNDKAEQFVKDGSPDTEGSTGSEWHGTLDQWRAAFPAATVTAFGFSLGSGVNGEGVLNAINFAGTRYTFAEHVVLPSKDDCKNGGWATSTKPVFTNQGQCVSSFASSKKRATGLFA